MAHSTNPCVVPPSWHNATPIDSQALNPKHRSQFAARQLLSVKMEGFSWGGEAGGVGWQGLSDSLEEQGDARDDKQR